MRPLGPGHEIVAGTTILEHLHRSNGLDVYDAFDQRRACRVIVKTLRPDRLRKPGAAEKLVREGRTLMRLAHPHVVRAYEVHTAPRPAIIMETLTGETLDHLITTTRRPLGAVELAILGTQLASALTYLHGEGILHLDLKPANIVVEAGRAKVIDLSHAGRPGRMEAGNGTWCYMAPEQVGGGMIGAASDVWGLGIVLHAAATGSCVLADMADLLDVDDPQRHARVPSLRTQRRRLPRALTDLVDACLDPEPAGRPPLGDVFHGLEALT